MTTVLVTGAAGRLGSQTVETLSEAGLDVRATDINYRSDLPVPLKLCDLRDGRAVYPLAEGCDAVVQLGNHPGPHRYVPPQQLYRENVAMDVNVFQAAVDVGAGCIVFSSSVQALAGLRHRAEDVGKPSCLAYLPIDGDAPACPGNTYALSKQAGENQLRYYARLHPEVCCAAIRFPFLYHDGYRHWYRMMAGFGGRRQYGNLDEGFSYLHVEDAASLILAIVRKSTPGYHQLFPAAPDNPLDMSIPEIIEEFYPNVPLRMPAEEMRSLVDISRIEQDWGWRPEHTNMLEELEGTDENAD